MDWQRPSWTTVVLDDNSVMVTLGEIIQILRTRLLLSIVSYGLLLVKTYDVVRRLGFLSMNGDSHCEELNCDFY